MIFTPNLSDIQIQIGWYTATSWMEPVAFTALMRLLDNYRCCYCGAEDGPFDLDHIVPISKGGHPTSIENLITACAPCNRSKGAKTIQEWQA